MKHSGQDRSKSGSYQRKARGLGRFSFSKDLRLDRSMREELSGDFGPIMDGKRMARRIGKGKVIYAVGDVTTATLLGLGYRPKVSVFDYRAGKAAARFPAIKKAYANPVCVHNGRGELSVGMWKAVRGACRKSSPSGIRVYGEEDLASLACIYFARNGEFVMYGMRGRGIAVIRVRRKMKDYVENILKRMAGISKDY